MQEGVVVGADGLARCWWGGGEDPLYREYHDREWGRPSADDRRLFEKLTLEGFQSGLSWLTILRKRPNFRRAFADFDVARVAAFGAADVERLLADASIVRNRAKIEATINNARRCAELAPEINGVQVRAHRIGVRPVRSRVRLEHERLGGCHLLHNYGHGGAGVTLSWGCAADVADLLAEG
jgi:DNA-3-methyladenine glycosylase I